MTLLYALFFGAGVSAFVYTKAGRRVGYSNSQSVWTIVGTVFVIATIFFWTILWTLGIN